MAGKKVLVAEKASPKATSVPSEGEPRRNLEQEARDTRVAARNSIKKDK